MAEAAHSKRVDLPADGLDSQLQRELASLNMLSWALSQSLDMDKVLMLALETTLRVTDSQAGAIYLVSEAGGKGFQLRAQMALTPDTIQYDPLIPYDDRQAQQVVASGGPLPVNWCKGQAAGAQLATEGDVGPAAGGPNWVSCVLTARNRLQGLMVVQLGEMAADESLMLRAIGQHVGIAVDNAQLYLRAQQDARRLRHESDRWNALNRAAVAVSGTRSEQAVYDTITHTLCELGLSAAICALQAAAPSSPAGSADDALVVVSVAVSHPRLIAALERLTGLSLVGHRFPLPRTGFYHQTFEENRTGFVPVAAEDVAGLLPARFAGLSPGIVRRAGLAHVISAPLRINGQTIALLLVGGKDLGAEDVPAMTSFARHASIAVENARLIESERRQRQEAEMLRDLVITVNSTLQLDQVLDRAVSRLQRLHQATACSVSFLEEDGETFVFKASTDPALDVACRITFPAAGSVAGQAIRERKVQITGDVRQFSQQLCGISRDTGALAISRSLLTAPLFAGDAPLGVIQVLSASPTAFNESDAQLLSTTAALIETAVARARTYTQAVQLAGSERHQREVADTLRRVAVLINASLDVDTVLEHILVQLAQVVDYDSASLTLVVHDQLTTRAIRGFAEPEKVLATTSPVSENSLFQEMLATRRPIVIANVQADPRYQAWAGAETVRSWMGVPLLVRDQVIGQLAVGRRRADATYTEHDAELAFAFAQQAANAIANAQLHEQEHRRLAEVERRNQELSALHGVTAAISSSLDIKVVLGQALAQALRVIEMEAGGVYLLDDSGDGLSLRVQDNLSPEFVSRASWLDKHSGLTGQLAQTGEPIVIEDLSAQIHNIQSAVTGPEWLMEAGYQSAILVPLRAHGRLQGTFFGICRRARRFSPVDIRLMAAIGDEMGVAVENARLHQVLQEYAADLEMRVEARTAEVDQERERLLTVLESAGEGIAITNADGLIEYANPAWERLTGQEAEQAIQHQLRIVDEETFPDVFASRRSTTRYQHVWRRELAGKRPDGTGYTVDLTVTPIFADAGEARQLTGLVAVYRDVTEYKELDRIKSEFMSTAAHELRGPLTSIMGFSELLLARQELSDDERKRFLQYINKHAHHLKELIDDLLDISRIESGASFTLDLENVDVRLLLEQEVHTWQAANPSHTYDLQATGAGATVRADIKRIQQVVRNLLSNATKYSPAGTQVTVGLTSVGKYVELSVSDQGIGMTPAELSRLFEKFWRANASSTAYGGTGLGLVIVKYIVEHHGGQIWVESQPGKGTLVHFTLLQTEHPTTVLIVEDEDSVREIEERILTSGGLVTLTASDGQQAIDLAWAHRPDLVLLDLMMPGMSGLEVLGMLKSHPATAMIPVVVVSARSGWQIIEETHMLGAADFLAKPFEYEELLGRVRRALVAAAHPAQGKRPTFHP